MSSNDIRSLVDTPALEQAQGQLPPLALAQQHALPLWREAWRRATQYETPPPEGVLAAQLAAAKQAAMGAFQAVPLPQLPQALASLGYERRIVDLLRFRAVRDLVLNPACPVDMLTVLPHLAPRAVAAVRFCELVESLADKIGDGPQQQPDMDVLIQARGQQERIAQWELTNRAGPQGQLMTMALTSLVTALSRHVPPERAPLPLAAYGPSDRLSRGRAWYTQLFRQLARHSDHFSTSDVRRWGVAAGMPYARYARRDHIIGWLADPTPEHAQRQVVEAMHYLRNYSAQSLRATDRTGADRLFKAGQRVRLSVAGTEQEGEIANCCFLTEIDPTADPQDAYSAYSRIQAVHPAAEIYLVDGTRRVERIDELELVPQPRKKRS